MRRHWSSYIEAFFNIRHANINIKVSERKHDNVRNTLNIKVYSCIKQATNVTHLRYHIGSASLVIFSFAFIIFFIYKEDNNTAINMKL